jgi:hypothetical protein
MTDADAGLKALLRADAPAARDPWFRIALIERMARRRLRRRLVVVGAAGAAGAALLAPLAPALSRLAADGVALPAAGVLVVLAATVWAVAQMRRPI